MTAEFPQLPESNGQPDHLAFLRGQVDLLDQEILDLVERRTALAIAVDLEKKSRGESIIASDRYNDTVQGYMDGVREDGPIVASDAVTLADTIMKIGIAARKRKAAEDREEPGAKLQRQVEAAGEAVV